jgi:hypothetical protein
MTLPPRKELRSSGHLSCAECGCISSAVASGWRAYLTDDEPPEVETFCPECSRKEFGDG